MRSLRILFAITLLAALPALAADRVSREDFFTVQHEGFLSTAQQVAAYSHVETIFPVRPIRHGTKVLALPVSPMPLVISMKLSTATMTTDDFMTVNNVSGLLIIKDGQVVLERYGLGRKASDRWTTFGVGAVVTSALAGVAIRDGAIKSLDSQVVDYVPALKGSAYDGVTVRQLLLMTSGVTWTRGEDWYGNISPDSDRSKFAFGKPGPHGENPVVAYLAKLARTAAPGTVFWPKDADPALLTAVLMGATHKHPADYLSQTIWADLGMESDGVWITDNGGGERGDCCISMTLRDEGRFAQFVLNGGFAGGVQIVPPDWMAQSTSVQVPDPPQMAEREPPGSGNGFAWQIAGPRDGPLDFAPGAYVIGDFGQSIYINRDEKLIVIMNCAWPDNAEESRMLYQIYLHAVIEALRKPKP